MARTGRKVKAVLPIVGNGPQNPIEAITPQEFHLTMDLNVFSAFFTVQKVLPYMSDKSAIVLISSIAGFQGGKNAIVYNAAKAAVRSMARSFTGELAERGIRANAISPGPTDTKAFGEFVNNDDDVRHGIVSQIPVGHIGRPAEIAAVALFLASDQSSYVTGAEVITDGGFTNPVRKLRQVTLEQANQAMRELLREDGYVRIEKPLLGYDEFYGLGALLVGLIVAAGLLRWRRHGPQRPSGATRRR